MEQLQSFAPFILLFLVMYLFMIRPQMKRQKNEKKFAAELKRGDRVITKSGMHGKVLELNDDGTCVNRNWCREDEVRTFCNFYGNEL